MQGRKPRRSVLYVQALGIDKFMSECRALTNICGNGFAAIVIAASEGELDRAKLTRALADRAGVLEPAMA